jgi:hypothetical protein
MTCYRGNLTLLARTSCRAAVRRRMAGSRGDQWLQGEVDAKCFIEFSHGGSGQPAYLLAYALDRD